MKTLLLASAAALATVAGAQAQTAEGQWHLGGGYSLFDADGGNLSAITARGGYDFNPYFGLEAEGSIGINEKDATFAGVDVDYKLEYALAGFAKVQYPFNEQFSVFARLGYGTAEIEASAKAGNAVVSADGNADGVIYGAGFEWAFAGPNAVRFDYARHDYEDDAEFDQWGVSYVRRF
ncbi:porin family protein [Woodsholea maritima]|uniref:porin family protein n=1 Tax=Woodsholea maritima TaxID=240237 RepID=UPI00037D8BF5|nr:porin family protein [Woodsholea maritima]